MEERGALEEWSNYLLEIAEVRGTSETTLRERGCGK